MSSVTTVQGSGGGVFRNAVDHASFMDRRWISGESLASVTAHMTRDFVLPSVSLWLARRLGRCLTRLMVAKQGYH